MICNRISKTHQRFSDRLRNPRVLTNPEDFLGENYEAVLNFWLILDELSKEKLKVVKERYSTLFYENRSEWRKARDLAWETAKEVLGECYAYNACWAAFGVTYSRATYHATLELIGMHKILEDHQQPLTFFQMFLEAL